MSTPTRGEGFHNVLTTVFNLSLKQKVFRTVDVVDATGLSRQLVHYHLKRMAEKGFCAHYGNGVYGEVNQHMLGEELTLQAESSQSNRPRETTLISYPKQAMLNAKIDFFQAIHQYQFMQGELNSGEVWDASEIRRSIISEINSSIAMLKATKKYVSSLRTLSTKYRYGRLTFRRKAVLKMWDEGAEINLRDWMAVEFFQRYMKMIIENNDTLSDNPEDAWINFVEDLTRKMKLDRTTGDPNEWSASGDNSGA